MKYKIHPAIGVARLGDAAAFFIGPEIPGLPPLGNKPGTSAPPYKDGGRIKPQAARFTIFEYMDRGGVYTVNREIDLSQKDVDSVEWKVHLANRKASFFNFDGLAGFDRRTAGRRNSIDDPAKKRIKHVGPRKKLEIDPGVRSIVWTRRGPEHFTSKDPLRERWPDPKPVPEITTLGRLLTDDDGRLLVLGGSGVTVRRPLAGAYDINHYANNDGWFDDVSDGPVTAVLKIKGRPVVVEPAWVICAPPDFAPTVTSVVTLYDVLYDIAARELTLPREAVYRSGGLERLGKLNADFKTTKGKRLRTYKPDFATEIFPILQRAVNMRFVFGPAATVHNLMGNGWTTLADPSAAAKSLRDAVLSFLRPPNASAGVPKPDMPKLLGDEPYPRPPGSGTYHRRARVTLTITQYEMMKQWAAGNFVGAAGVPPPIPLPQPITPDGLDRAALEACVGAGMYPGIEASWQIRYPSIFKEPFRIDPSAASPYPGDRPGSIRAGHFTRQMALPWQADFLQCKEETAPAPFAGKWGWWPSQRPDAVYATKADLTAGRPPVPWHRATGGGVTVTWPSGGDTPSYKEMLLHWKKFGFVVDDGSGAHIEEERDPNVP